jgi:hypothetical protein
VTSASSRVHPATRSLKVTPIEPFEMLDPRFARICRGQVDVQFHREVRRDRQPRMVGEGGHLQERGDSADPRSIRHDVVGGAMADQLPVLRDAGQHFPGGDRRVETGGQGGVPFGVVTVERLFDPDQTERFQDVAHAPRSRTIPLLVRVDHQREVVAQVPAHGFDAPDVRRAVRLADLDFDPADPLLPRRRGIRQHLVGRGMQEAAGGVVAANRVPMGAEQLGERQTRAPGLHVPQGHVERGDGLDRQAAAAHRRAGPAEFLPQPGDIVGVLADQRRGDLLGVGKLARSAGALGIAEPQAVAAVGGFDLRKQDGDLRHRLLPAGQHLGVADRHRQRQVARSEADPCDAIPGYNARSFHCTLPSGPVGELWAAVMLP